MHCCNIGRVVALLALLLVLSNAARAEVTITQTTYKGWANAYRMTNGTVELVVAPSVGRVMRYGYVGGPNVLWENPTVAGKPIPLGTWPNTGGDKIWPWPQGDWGKLLPVAWPPPPAADQAPHQAAIVGKDTLRLTSGIVSPWGIRIVRDIRLAPSGTTVYFTNHFTRVSGGESPPVGVWTITQVPATDWVMARLLPAADKLTGGYQSMSGAAAFKAVAKTPEGMLRVERNPAQATKIGTDGDLVATLQGGTLFTVRNAPDAPLDNATLSYVPGERAQFYNQPDDVDAAKKGITPYIEMEMTSPKKTLKKGETVTLSIVWNLRHMPPAEQNPEGVAGVIKGIK
jgi:hypothetical protein